MDMDVGLLMMVRVYSPRDSSREDGALCPLDGGPKVYGPGVGVGVTECDTSRAEWVRPQANPKVWVPWIEPATLRVRVQALAWA